MLVPLCCPDCGLRKTAIIKGAEVVTCGCGTIMGKVLFDASDRNPVKYEPGSLAREGRINKRSG